MKALIAQGMRSQDIHALINHERPATINFGRITTVKNNANIDPATAEEVEFFEKKKRSFDPVTGLNLYEDERLIRAREAMILAVTIFNTASYRFKSEMFAVLANVAWTYLMHEHYARKSIPPLNKDGSSFALSHMLTRADCPLSKGIRNNLTAIKQIRDEVEHKLLRRSDLKWLSLFQACCLNFDKTIVSWFGPRVTLQNELSIALQFGKLELEHAAQLQSYDVPAYVTALDANLTKDMSEAEVNDIEYQFKVIYTLDSASKGKAHIQFLQPDSEEAKDVKQVLQKYKVADELYPHKPMKVGELVRLASKKPFNSHDHTQAWKRHKVRPNSGVKSPEKTNKNYCIYHPAHKDYTYNDKWVGLLVDELAKAAEAEKANAAEATGKPIAPEATGSEA